MNVTETNEFFLVHKGTYAVGFHAARIFLARNEVAHNPYKPLTTYWYSFNLGAKEYLISLPNIKVEF